MFAELVDWFVLEGSTWIDCVIPTWSGSCRNKAAVAIYKGEICLFMYAKLYTKGRSNFSALRNMYIHLGAYSDFCIQNLSKLQRRSTILRDLNNVSPEKYERSSALLTDIWLFVAYGNRDTLLAFLKSSVAP